MKSRTANHANWNLGRIVAILILLTATPLAFRVARATAADGSANSNEDAAIKQVVAGFSDGWNSHNASRRRREQEANPHGE